MNIKKLTTLLSLSNEAQDWLKAKLLSEWKKADSDKTKLSFRDLEKITELDSKQIRRIIHQDKFPHFHSLVKACQGLLSISSKPTKSKKRHE